MTGNFIVPSNRSNRPRWFATNDRRKSVSLLTNLDERLIYFGALSVRDFIQKDIPRKCRLLLHLHIVQGRQSRLTAQATTASGL